MLLGREVTESCLGCIWRSFISHGGILIPLCCHRIELRANIGLCMQLLHGIWETLYDGQELWHTGVLPTSPLC